MRALSLAWPGGSVRQKLTRKVAYTDMAHDEQLAGPPSASSPVTTSHRRKTPAAAS